MAHRRALVTALLALMSTAGSAWAQQIADALMRGQTERLPDLLAQGADVNATQADGTAPLHWAVFGNDLETAKLLLDAGANPEQRTGTGMTPLLLAAENGNADLARLLLAAGAGADTTFRNGETPLMMAARTGNPETIGVLIDAGADIDATETLRGTTALMWAAAYANPDAVATLIERGADLGVRSAKAGHGHDPYLAPSARERINEFIRGTGLRGAALDDEETQDAGTGTAQAGDDGAGTALALPSAEALEAAREAARRRIAAVDGIDPALVAVDDTVGSTVVEQDTDGGEFFSGRSRQTGDSGGLTALIFAAREGDLESARLLVEAGADVNQTSEYGWTPLLTAIQNRYYTLAMYLLDQGADPNIANKGGWNPLYIATDNRNIEGGDYPTRKPDLPHLDLIRRLLEEGADPNLRMASSTETRTIFTHQWLYEEGATPLLRAAQSGDLELIELLLDHGADPSIPTDDNVTPLMVAAGIGWVEGVTFEWSREQTLEVMKRLIELGADVNAQDTLDYRTALMGAAHKGHTEGVQLLVDHGADLSLHDIGSRDSIHALAGVTWQAVDYADGLVRVGVQSATEHPETAALIRRLMRERGLEVPPEGRTLDSICVVDLCR